MNPDKKAYGDYLLQCWAHNTRIHTGTGYPTSSPEQKERLGGVFTLGALDLTPLDVAVIDLMRDLAKKDPESHQIATLEYSHRDMIISSIRIHSGFWTDGQTRFHPCKKANAKSYFHYLNTIYNIKKTNYYNKLEALKIVVSELADQITQ